MRVFVTGASGHIGSALVPELIAAGHEVVGLARSDSGAAAVTARGATVHRGDLEDLDGLRKAAEESDGVIHLAFDHQQMLAGNYAGAIATNLAVVHALGDALKGTDKPFVIASGTGASPQATPARALTEDDVVTDDGSRMDAENVVVEYAEHGVRSSSVRIAPITHSVLDRHGFARILISIAREKGVAGYAGDGANRWSAVNTYDVAHLFRLALEKAPAGTRWHGVGDEGIPLRDIAQSIGDHLGIPTASIPGDELQAHFGFLAMLIARDLPTSNLKTRRDLGWEPTHLGLLAEFDDGDYFA
jgi:nucleoside-diphosphate-sugar epimerase